MGSGAIYAVIVAVWALVLIPLWLRNHDRSGEVKSIDRRRDAMNRAFGNGSGRAPAQSSSDGALDADEWHEPTAAEVAAARRRMVFAVFIGLFFGALVLTLLGYLPLWFLALPAVLLIGFTLVVRRQVAASQARASRTARTAPAAAPEQVTVRQPRGRSYSAAQSAASADLPEVRRAPHAPPAADSWEAVNAPLPTYVSAPRASRVPRVIDLAHPGEWSGEAMVQEARKARSADAFSKSFDDEGVDFVADEMRRALPTDDDAFFDQLAAETSGRRVSDSEDGFFDQYSARAVND